MPLHTLHLGSLSSMAFSSLPHPSHWSPRASSKPQRGQVPSTNRSARNLSMKDSNSSTEYGNCISKLLQTEGVGGVAGALQKSVSQKPVNERQQYKQRVIINTDGATGALHKLVGQKLVNKRQQFKHRVCYMYISVNTNCV